MLRSVAPEVLDTLPAGHADAVASRRDLRIFNRVMGNRRWLRRTLLRELDPSERAIEAGAGDGELARSLHARIPGVAALDLCPAPADWPANAQWLREDVLAFGGWGEFDALFACLFLHHLEGGALASLGSRLGERVRLIAACEPLRARVFQRAFGALCAVTGANAVSRHDGRVSIAAGFRGGELPELLGLDPGRWHWTCTHTLRGAYRFVARRR